MQNIMKPLYKRLKKDEFYFSSLKFLFNNTKNPLIIQIIAKFNKTKLQLTIKL